LLNYFSVTKFYFAKIKRKFSQYTEGSQLSTTTTAAACIAAATATVSTATCAAATATILSTASTAAATILSAACATATAILSAATASAVAAAATSTVATIVARITITTVTAIIAATTALCGFAFFLEWRQIALAEDFTFTNPDFQSQFAINSLCFNICVVNISAESMQRCTTFFVFFRPSHISATNTSTNADFDAFSTYAHR
jgi:hypothetical protein